MIKLKSQSNKVFSLLKNTNTNLYYIRKNKNNSVALIGDKERALNFILDGIEQNQEDLKGLKFRIRKNKIQ